MGWMDTFGVVANAFGSQPPAAPKGYTTWNAKLRESGYQTNYGGPPTINWSDMGSGALGAGISRPFSSSGGQSGGLPPARPPERFDVQYPYSAGQAFGAAPAPRQSTEGDIFGSVLGALGSTAGSLNLANVVPWFMERVNVLADEFSKSDIPVVGDAIRTAKMPLDIFAEGVSAASKFAAPILDALPTMVRDGQLYERAKMYRSIAAGSGSDYTPLADFGKDPLGSLAKALRYAMPGGTTNPAFGQDFLRTVGAPLSIAAEAYETFKPGGPNLGRPSPITDLLGKPVLTQAVEYDNWRRLLFETVDPNGRAGVEARMNILRDSIDIPMSVKVAIERNPNLSDDDIEKLLSVAPEGRQWSYQAGPAGIVQNMGNPLIFYLGEVAALGAAGRALRVAGAGSTILGVPTLTAGAGKALSGAAAIQKYAMASGLAITPITTLFDGVARYMGDEEAIAWFDRINRSSKFSDDPAVQLVTSFSVNPFAAVKPAGRALAAGARATGQIAMIPARATIAFAKGLRGFDVSSDTAGRMERFATSDAAMVRQIRLMYRLQSDDEARAFIDQNYDHRGEAFDETLGAALEEVVGRLPAAERMVLDRAWPDPVGYTRHVAETYADDAMDLLERDGAAVAERWREKAWSHHNYAGRFSPELAAKNARDYRLVKERTYEARARLNAVVGYRETFPPQAQSLAAAQLDEITLADGTVPVAGLRGVDALIEAFPVLSRHWTGLIHGEDVVPRATVERILERATAEWQRVTKQNPVRARTGADPILRPNSPTLTRDAAEALGTSIETLNAIDAGGSNADELDLIYRFLGEKLDNRDVRQTLTPEQVVERAQRYVVETTRPWRDAGTAIAGAERRMVAIRSELAKLRAMPEGVVQADEIIRLEQAYAAENTLVRAASDPPVPFVTEVAHARPEGIQLGRDVQLTELATRRAEAMTRLRDLETIHDAGAALGGDDWFTLFRQGPSGAPQYSGNLPAMSPGTRRALGFSDHMGDFEAWATLGNRIDQVEHLLTKQQRRRAHAVLDTGGWRSRSPAQTIRRADVESGMGEDAVEAVARLWAERQAILTGTSEYSLRRTAGMALPPRYAAMADEMAATGSVERGIVHDPIFTSRTHPANVARLQDALGSPDTFPAARAVIESDPVLIDRFTAFAQREGWVDEAWFEGAPEAAGMDLPYGGRLHLTDDVLGDATYARALADALIPADFVRPTPGLPVPSGVWDEAILANDRGALEELAETLRLDETPARPTSTPVRVARRAAAEVPKVRPSARYARRLADADNTMSPDQTVMDAPGNRIGLDVLSVMNHGITGTRPATINRVVELLRAIENGDARRAGIGDDLAAEAQRVANELLDQAVKDAPRPETTGIFTKGVFPDDEMALAAEIDHLLKYDDANPLGTLQYGLKTRPKDAVVLEWSKVPGLAEELMAGRFQAFPERVIGAQARQAFNWVFGARSNAEIRAASKVSFMERAAALGVDGQTAAAIHDAWRTFANESRLTARRGATGEFRVIAGDNPLYATVDNIPGPKLNQVAHQTIDELYGAGKIDNADGYLSTLKRIPYDMLFRESSSYIRRTLADHAGSLGKALAGAYGLAVHNRAVTTYYYWFRFALDIRYQAMNYLEAQILHLGRAGLRKGEIDQRPLVVTEEYVRNLGADAMSNTGYPLSHDRVAWAYRTFLKERPDALRSELKGLAAEDGEMAQRALEQLVRNDPQIADMRREFGASPDAYLKELDAWHAKMLDSASIDEQAALIDEAIADAVRESPELAQVYARLGAAEKGLWEDISASFYGNPNRSRAERFLNSYLLFWPLSYTIKSTKWFARVLFDRAGGLPTNAGGAYLFDRMATTHQQLLATDVEYQDWFEKHRTLVFVAQMMFPVSFDGTGVSLNPAMRSIFFERQKAFWDVGPIYTANHVVRPLAKELYADLYPTLKDVPGFDGIYRTLTGQQEPAPPSPGADRIPLERNP